MSPRRPGPLVSLVACAVLGLAFSGLGKVAAQDARVLTLADALELVELQNHDVGTAREAVHRAELQEEQAYATIRPSVNLTGGYQLNDEEIEFDFGGAIAPLMPYLGAVYANHGAGDPSIPDPALFAEASGDPQISQYRHDFRGSLTVEQTLYTARARPFIRQARIHIEQAENGVDQVAFELRGAVIDTYFSVYLQLRLVEVAERNAELARLAWERAVAALETDVGNRFEVVRAQVEVANAERDVENARTAYEIGREVLATLLDEGPDFDVVAPPTVEGAGATPSQADDAATAHPTVESQEIATRLHEEQIREARARWYPAFFAVAQTNLQRENPFLGDQFTWIIQLGASWDLYDGGVRGAIRRQRESDVVAAELRREQAVDQAMAQIRMAELQVEQLERDVESARAQVALAEENVALTESAWELGAATALDIQFAREQRYLSDLALVSAEVRLQQQLYDQRRLLGLE